MKKIILISMLALLVLGLTGAVLAETGRWPIHNSSSPNADVLTSAKSYPMTYNIEGKGGNALFFAFELIVLQ